MNGWLCTVERSRFHCLTLSICVLGELLVCPHVLRRCVAYAGFLGILMHRGYSRSV